MGRKCILWRTCYSQTQEPGLFSFPKAEKLRKIWLENLDLKPDAISQIKSKKVVCFRHFKKDDVFFDETRARYKKRDGKNYIQYHFIFMYFFLNSTSP